LNSALHAQPPCANLASYLTRPFTSFHSNYKAFRSTATSPQQATLSEISKSSTHRHRHFVYKNHNLLLATFHCSRVPTNRRKPGLAPCRSKPLAVRTRHQCSNASCFSTYANASSSHEFLLIHNGRRISTANRSTVSVADSASHPVIPFDEAPCPC
jgi:hypothetical protein